GPASAPGPFPHFPPAPPDSISILSDTMTSEEIGAAIREMGKQARAASHALTKLSTEQKNAILLAMADAVVAREAEILAANEEDLAAADALGLTSAMKDRLRLDHDRIAAMAQGIR